MGTVALGAYSFLTGTSTRPALPFIGTRKVSSTSSVSTETQATPPKGAWVVSTAFSPDVNAPWRCSTLNVVSFTTGNSAGFSPVTVVSSLTNGALICDELIATT